MLINAEGAIAHINNKNKNKENSKKNEKSKSRTNNKKGNNNTKNSKITTRTARKATITPKQQNNNENKNDAKVQFLQHLTPFFGIGDENIPKEKAEICQERKKKPRALCQVLSIQLTGNQIWSKKSNDVLGLAGDQVEISLTWTNPLP